MSENKETTFETLKQPSSEPQIQYLWENKNSPLYFVGFPGGSDGKESTYNAGDLGSIPGLGWRHGEGNG